VFHTLSDRRDGKRESLIFMYGLIRVQFNFGRFSSKSEPINHSRTVSIPHRSYTGFRAKTRGSSSLRVERSSDLSGASLMDSIVRDMRVIRARLAVDRQARKSAKAFRKYGFGAPVIGSLRLTPLRAPYAYAYGAYAESHRASRALWELIRESLN